MPIVQLVRIVNKYVYSSLMSRQQDRCMFMLIASSITILSHVDSFSFGLRAIETIESFRSKSTLVECVIYIYNYCRFPLSFTLVSVDLIHRRY
jgi:hypothetical protein